MAVFKGFKPQGLQKIATRMGYAGDMEKFDDYIKANPDKEREMIVYRSKAQQMARGGSVRRFAEGGANPKGVDLMPKIPIPPSVGGMEESADPRQLPQANVPQTDYEEGDTIGDVSAKMLETPGLPEGGTTIPVGTQITGSQLIDPRGDEGIGQVDGTVDVDTAKADTTKADPVAAVDANLTTAAKSATGVSTALDALNAAQLDPNDPKTKVIAAQQTESSVGNLDAAQGKATLLENPVQREIQEGELISGVADAEKAAKFAEQIEAAQATPSEKATVQGQLKTLTEGFDANNPPPWAAATLRGVQSQMAARGMGASSMAGQAMIQGALESALPIAQADAQTMASFEAQNLSNRQARAMLAAEQRAKFIGQEFDQAFQARVQNASKISDVANQNFTAEQNIAMENSRAVNTMNLANLNNNQALVMAEAAALANLDTANLNNRQQASVKNAQTFLDTEMANLSNRQQTDLFKTQQRVQSLFTDQAAENAASQFNATSKNQTDQFFANLASQTSQFNASQANAQSQFNAGQENVVERFNAEMNNQRDQYNATNQLAIAQNNAVWRREVATADTAAINRANELNANAVLDISKEAYDNLWSYYSDTMEWAWTSADNQLDRINKLAMAQLSADAQRDAQQMANDSAAGGAVGDLIGELGKEVIKGLF
jgi:hypothetical protein